MDIEPIIDTRFKRFRKSFELDHLKDTVAFERFVNHAILSSHQPDAFGADAQLLDEICVGGDGDMGIDGIGIKLNGLLVRGIDEVDDILDRFKRASVEFIFIQSKYSKKFDRGDFLIFCSGALDFLSDEHRLPRNDKLSHVLEIKDHLLSDDVVVLWENNPTVRLYYVALGRWRDQPYLSAEAEGICRDIAALPTYGEARAHFVDAQALKTICDNNENTFTASIEAMDTMPLPPSGGVDNSCVTLCYAGEFVKLLTTDEGVIRKSLFEDNVRDYQGTNNINAEIAATIKSEPDKFGLFNNGITIVCDEFISSNRRITIKNPQIVNGCQTSHVLFSAHEDGVPIDTVPVQLKLIATNEVEVINQVVRGTNRQNIVLDEAFEATRQFHKELEEFFEALGNKYQRIYYERRSKQFQHDPRVKHTDKVNLRILTQVVVGMFFDQPELAHRHEAWLLRKFEDKLYLERHSKLPYYTAALTFLKMERAFRETGVDERRLYSFRAHLAMVFRQLVGGRCPRLDHERAIDKYCAGVLDILTSQEQFRDCFEKAVATFEVARSKWIEELGRSADGIKDITEFTGLLLEVSSDERGGKERVDGGDDRKTGRVVKVFVDRRRDYGGFIRRTGKDLFFHRRDNPGLSFDALEGELVYFTEGENSRGWPIGRDVERVN